MPYYNLFFVSSSLVFSLSLSVFGAKLPRTGGGLTLTSQPQRPFRPFFIFWPGIAVVCLWCVHIKARGCLTWSESRKRIENSDKASWSRASLYSVSFRPLFRYEMTFDELLPSIPLEKGKTMGSMWARAWLHASCGMWSVYKSRWWGHARWGLASRDRLKPEEEDFKFMVTWGWGQGWTSDGHIPCVPGFVFPYFMSVGPSCASIPR